MGIGPVIGIRPITMVKLAPSDRDLSGVFAVEFRGQEQEESDSLRHQTAARGLEDEAMDEADELEFFYEDSSLSDDPNAGPPQLVSIFA